MGSHNRQRLFLPHVPHFHRFCYKSLLSRTVIIDAIISPTLCLPIFHTFDLSADTHKTDQGPFTGVRCPSHRHLVCRTCSLIPLDAMLDAVDSCSNVHIIMVAPFLAEKLPSNYFPFSPVSSRVQKSAPTAYSHHDPRRTCLGPQILRRWMRFRLGQAITPVYKQYKPTPAFPSSCASLPVHT